MAGQVSNRRNRFTWVFVWLSFFLIWLLNSYFNLIPVWIWTLPEWPDDHESHTNHHTHNENEHPTKYQETNNFGDSSSSSLHNHNKNDNEMIANSNSFGSGAIGPNQAVLDYSPKETNLDRLSYFCPKRENLCLQGAASNGFRTPYKEDEFNITELMFGTGIHPRFKVLRDWMFAKYDSTLLSRMDKECTFVDESFIVLHAWYPHMLWEVWNRIATQLFQYQVLDRFLSKNHRFAIMNLHDIELTSVHDLLLSPFTDYPFVHLQTLMENQTNSLFPKYLSNTYEYFELKWNHQLYDSNIVKRAYSQSSHDCTCFREMYWCGFDLNLTKDVKQLPSVFDYLGSHEFGEFSWDMARWYKWYYQQTFGPPPTKFVNKKTKPRVAFIQRRSWKRPWANLDDIIEKCRTLQDRWTCDIIYFEDMTHIQAIWNMSMIDILVGIHGSGLVNGIFMNERATLLEIIPVRAPGYAQQSGTIMTWIYSRVPQRHAFFPLKEDEQAHEMLRDWQKPFNLSWQRLEPFLNYLFETSHDFCKHEIPQALQDEKFQVAPKAFNKKSALYPYRPTCNNFTYVTW